jgi:hypothetical protein
MQSNIAADPNPEIQYLIHRILPHGFGSGALFICFP